MKLVRYIVLGFFILGIASLVISKVTQRAQLSSLTGDLLPASKQWQTVGHKVLMDQSWEMQTPSVWGVPGVDGDPNGLRLWLEGSFASSDPNVKMMVMNKENWGKWQSGFPPLPLGSAMPGETFHLHADTAGYFFGFFPTPRAAVGIPTSAGSLIAGVLEKYQESHPAPIAMTAHVEVLVESFATESQAEAERRLFSATQK
ncbi:MAG: hypothetical protein ABSF73_03095 [Terriglobia bacterium]|jgi:hypothetical protein